MPAKKRKYKKVSCHDKKSTAQKKAKSMRNVGKTASVRKVGKGYCVFSAGASRVKKNRRRK